MNEIELRQAVLDTARAMNACGINRGTAGNVSARFNEGFLITPTGMTYQDSTPADMVVMKLDGASSSTRTPSSEWRFHRDIYAAKNAVNAIVHTHSPFATSLACLGKNIPPFHYMIARFGGATIRCAPYATYGTQALSDHALTALEDRCACLLANHGMIVCGVDLKNALALAIEFEALCEHYWRALQIGEPQLLSDAEMEVVLEKFSSYGQQIAMQDDR